MDLENTLLKLTKQLLTFHLYTSFLICNITLFYKSLDLNNLCISLVQHFCNGDDKKLYSYTIRFWAGGKSYDWVVNCLHQNLLPR